MRELLLIFAILHRTSGQFDPDFAEFDDYDFADYQTLLELYPELFYYDIEGNFKVDSVYKRK